MRQISGKNEDLRTPSLKSKIRPHESCAIRYYRVFFFFNLKLFAKILFISPFMLTALYSGAKIILSIKFSVCMKWKGVCLTFFLLYLENVYLYSY